MEPKYEYSQAETAVYHTNYVRNSKAIGVLWGIFTICFAIINIVVFVQPQWVGSTAESHGIGYFGLWKYCSLLQEGQDLVCSGQLNDFETILTPAFRAATVFVGLSVVIILLCIVCMLLFFFFHSSTVFHICGWMQVFSAVCMVIGVLCFPAGWDADEVRDVCGSTARDYNPGDCGIRWAYILAIIGVFDAIVLSALAFVLGTRYVKLLPDQPYINNGEINSAFVTDTQSVGSRKSNPMQPVMMMPPPSSNHHHHHPHSVMSPPNHDHDRFSEYSHRTGRSKSSNYKAEYSSSIQNFQL